jgi:hypothetical protein
MSEWISLKNRTPDTSDCVLVFDSSQEFKDLGPCFVARYFDDINDWHIQNDTYPNDSHYARFAPTHWMPLPEPPKEEK